MNDSKFIYFLGFWTPTEEGEKLSMKMIFRDTPGAEVIIEREVLWGANFDIKKETERNIKIQMLDMVEEEIRQMKHKLLWGKP
jgi:hypothetical protein